VFVSGFVTNTAPRKVPLLVCGDMRLLDRIAQATKPFIVKSNTTGAQTRLSGVGDFAAEVATCPLRYVLSDELTCFCAAFAYSKGSRTLTFMDLIHVPAERVWVEWCQAPWIEEVTRYGFGTPTDTRSNRGRRGALLKASPDGRSGTVRCFWGAGESEEEIFASSMEAHFNFDAPESFAEYAGDAGSRVYFRVVDNEAADASTLERCFAFSFEQSWADYYEKGGLSGEVLERIVRSSLGTIALNIPLLLSFFLLLGARSVLPQRSADLTRLNCARQRDHKRSLLEHIEVQAPLLPGPSNPGESGVGPARRAARLHHVRGHLVRRHNKVFWRVPHLRGNARGGVVRSRTVTLNYDQPLRGNGPNPQTTRNEISGLVDSLQRANPAATAA
jgi:hypothetical protein